MTLKEAITTVKNLSPNASVSISFETWWHKHDTAPTGKWSIWFRNSFYESPSLDVAVAMVQEEAQVQPTDLDKVDEQIKPVAQP